MLRPINAQTQAPLGIFNVDSTWQTAGFEGGYVGYLNDDGYGIQVSLATAAIAAVAQGNVIGLIDDSTTGSAYSTLFGSLLQREAASSLIGPGTEKGSDKCTIWTQPGLYITDQVTGVTAGTPALLYSTDATGKLNTASNGAAVARYLATTNSNSGILESLVSPLDTADDLMLIYFFGQAIA